MSDNQARLRELSLLMPAIQYIQKWSNAKTAEYVTAIESAFKAQATVDANKHEREGMLKDLEFYRHGYTENNESLLECDKALEQTGFRWDVDGDTTAEAITWLHKKLVDLQATVEKCRAAGFIDEKGEVRKVNGSLCLDDDGVIVADNSTVYFTDEFGDIIEYDIGGVENLIPSGLFWSTRQAAERAKGGGDA